MTLEELELDKLVRPSLSIRSAAITQNIFWNGKGERMVNIVVSIDPQFKDPIQKDFKGTEVLPLLEQVKTFLQTL